MFNVRPERLIPWLYVDPEPADVASGFRINVDGSLRDAQRRTRPGSFGLGAPRGTLSPWYPDAAQALAQPLLNFSTPSTAVAAQSALQAGLPQFSAGRHDDVPGFNFTLLNDTVPTSNHVGSGSDAQRQKTIWPEGTRAEPEQLANQQTAPTPKPPAMKRLPSLISPQPPEWLYKAGTPVPELSTAVDPRTGRRIVPYEPLIRPVGSHLKTDQHGRRDVDAFPYVVSTGRMSDPDSAEVPSAEPGPSLDASIWPTDINLGPSASTAPHADPEETPEAVIGNARLMPPMGSGPYAETDGIGREVPRPAVVMPQPAGAAPALPAGSVADSNFILAKAGDAEEPQSQQRTALPQNQAPELTDPVTSNGPVGRPPEHRFEQAFSRSLEDHRRATADQIEELVGTISTFGSRIYEDSILKAKDDLARLAEKLRDDPREPVLSILNSFPQTRVEGKLLGGIAAVFTILANAKRGLEFERAVLQALNDLSRTTKINKNTSKIGIEGLGRSIPDVLQKGITEIKSGVEINNSVQLKIQAAYAELFRVPLNLIVSPTTKHISEAIKGKVSATGGTIPRFNPATGAFTTFK